MRCPNLSFGALAVALFGASAIAAVDASTFKIARRRLLDEFKPSDTYSVTNLERSIDLEKVYVRERWQITIKNTAQQPATDFYLPFSPEDIERIGSFEARDSDVKATPYITEAAARDGIRPGPDEYAYYRIEFPEPVEAKEEKAFRISFTRLASLKPLPASIEQSESQYLQYTTSAYALLTYPVESQSLSLLIAQGSKYENYTSKDGFSPKASIRKLVYGPFKNAAALVSESVSVRYEYTRPLLHTRVLERDIEVSHWGGNVAFEERYWFENLAAGLKNQYSRLQYAMQVYQNSPVVAMKEVRIPLRGGSTDAYFTDDIGNVSTSRFWTNDRAAELVLKPRYPLFGGWKYSFRIGWNGNADEYVRRGRGGSGYVLRVPFLEGPKQGDGTSYEVVQIRVVLPEGASNIRHATPIPIVHESVSLHNTFMDTVGRPTLTLTARNLVDEQRGAELLVTYDLPWGAQFRKPLAVAAAAFALFAGAWVVGRLDTSIGKKTNVVGVSGGGARS